jgi:putative peptidoglycan lipid II flippase
MTRASVARAGLTVAAWFLLSRMLGSIRLIVTTNQFTPADLGLFYAAFRLPDLVFQLVAAGAMGSALIPILAGLFVDHDEKRAWSVVSTVTTLLLGGLTVLATIAFVSAPELVRLGTPGFSDAQVAKTVDLTRVMIIGPIFLALGAVVTSVLNARNLFVASSIAPVAYNLSIILGSVALGPALGIEGLAVAVVAGSAAHFLVQLRALLRTGFRYRPTVGLGDPATRQALVLMGPRAIGLGVTQITFIVVTALATGLGAPAVAAFSIAFLLLQIPMGLVSVPLGIVLLPALSERAAGDGDASFVRAVALSLRLLLFVMVAMAGLLAATSDQVVALIAPTFDAASAALVADTFVVLLAGLPAHAMIVPLARAFYARQNTKTPVLLAIMAVAITTAVAASLVGPFGLGGIAFAIALAAWAEALGLAVLLRKAVPGLELGRLGWSGVRAITASGAASLAAVGTLQVARQALGPGTGLISAVVALSAAMVVFVFVIIVVSYVVRADEPMELLAFARAALRRPGDQARSLS